MNSTVFFNAVKSAQKPAAIGLATIFGLGVATVFATVISLLLILLIPVLVTASKAAIFGYLLFLAGWVSINIKEQCQKKEAHTIAMLPLCNPYGNCINQVAIENDILITPPPIETTFKLNVPPKQSTWEPGILSEIRRELPKAQSDNKPLNMNNRLATTLVCWQAISQAARLLNNIKASEMKTIASELEISGYRKMNKTQLLIEIVAAHESAPEFS